MRRCHSLKSLIPRRHSQTHFQRRCLGHTSLSMHGDRRVYSVPLFQPGVDPFLGHPSRNGKMPVYRAPFIYSPIHRDTTTSMARGPSAVQMKSQNISPLGFILGVVVYLRVLQRLHICFKANRPKFCRPARSRTQKQVVGHDNRGNKPYVQRTPNSKLILSLIDPRD